MRNPEKIFLCALVISIALGLPKAARTADHDNLEAGLPLTIEDAYPIAYRGREIQMMTRYEQTEDDDHRIVLDPRLEFGIAPNAQATLSVPFLLGSADPDHGGDIGVEGLYNFNQETIWLPAFSAALHADLPTGEGSEGVDTEAKLLASKHVLPRLGKHALHINLSWNRNAAAEDDERENYYAAAIGSSHRVGPDTILIADFVREQEEEEGQNANILEAGFRHQLAPFAVASFGAGTGLGEDSPDFRATLGFQYSF